MDFEGNTLSTGCDSQFEHPKVHERLSLAAINSGRLQIDLIDHDSNADLIIAAPVKFLPTGSMEGALLGEVHISGVLGKVRAFLGGDVTLRIVRTSAISSTEAKLLDEDRRVLLIRPISPVLGHPITLAVELSISKNEAYAPLSWLVFAFLTIALVTLIFVIHRSRIIARWIVGPLAKLEATADLIAEGDLTRQMLSDLGTPAEDRLSKLTHSIHRMVLSLKNTEGALTHAVNVRTAQVQQVEADRRLKELALASTESGILIIKEEDSGIDRVLYANAAFYRLTGTDPSAVLGAEWPQLLLTQCRAAVTHGADAFRAESLPQMLVFTRKDGARLFLSISTTSFAGTAEQSSPHKVIVISDISEQVRAEKAHQARLESLREVVFECDLSGACMFLSQSWQRITGYPVSQSLGKRLTDFLESEDLAVHIPALRGVRDDERKNYVFEARLQCLDGMYRWVRIDTGALHNEHGDTIGYSGTLSDVTDRHETNMALALRDRALQAASNGIVIVSVESPGQPIIYINPAFAQITGYSAEEALGRNCRFLHGTDRRQPEIAMLRKAIEQGRACEVTVRNYRKDGTMFWNQLAISPVCNPSSGEVTHYVGVQTDITDRKESEEMLVEWLSRLDAIFTLSPDPIVCFDSNGDLSYANAAAERTFQSSLGEMKQMNLSTFVDHLRRFAASDSAIENIVPPSTTEQQTLEEQLAGATAVIHLSRPEQRVLQQTYRYCGSTSTSLVLYYRDITRETELDRMKSDFLSTAAHELRTPMASIMGFSELLMMRKYDESKTRELLSTINRQAHRLTNLLSDLLDLARIEARRAEGLHFEWTSLQAMIDDALTAFHTPQGREPVIRQACDPSLLIRADKDKFQQALLNLLSNAYKFSPAGGPVQLEVVKAHPGNASLVGIAVKDQGIGLSPDEQKRVFERFYRSDRSGHIPGTGLGLSLVKEIMTIHEGDVSLESSTGKGTCVTVWFPSATSPQALHESECV